MMKTVTFPVFMILYAKFNLVTSHARLLEPPSRSSMWRFGFDNPADYQVKLLSNQSANITHWYTVHSQPLLSKNGQFKKQQIKEVYIC